MQQGCLFLRAIVGRRGLRGAQLLRPWHPQERRMHLRARVEWGALRVPHRVGRHKPARPPVERAPACRAELQQRMLGARPMCPKQVRVLGKMDGFELRHPRMDGPVVQLRRGVRVHVYEKVLNDRRFGSACAAPWR